MFLTCRAASASSRAGFASASFFSATTLSAYEMHAFTLKLLMHWLYRQGTDRFEFEMEFFWHRSDDTKSTSISTTIASALSFTFCTSLLTFSAAWAFTVTSFNTYRWKSRIACHQYVTCELNLLAFHRFKRWCISPIRLFANINGSLRIMAKLQLKHSKKAKTR